MPIALARPLLETRPDVQGLVHAQHGLATLAQFATLGVKRGVVMRAVQTGRWRRVADGVYAVTGSADAPEQRLLAAVLAVGGDAVASYRAAAWLLGLRGFGSAQVVLEVSTATRCRAQGVIVHRMKVEARDRKRVRGVPTTQPGRTIIDLAPLVEPSELGPLLDDTIRRGLVRIALVKRLLGERRGPGHPGVAALARLVAERSGEGWAPTESALEDRFELLLAGAGIPLPRRQHRLADEQAIFSRVDFVYEPERIAIFLDGRGCHSDWTAQQRDLARVQRAARLGWRSMRFTWEDVTRRGAEVVATVRAMLHASGGTPFIAH